jgi:hypothetical protein
MRETISGISVTMSGEEWQRVLPDITGGDISDYIEVALTDMIRDGSDKFVRVRCNQGVMTTLQFAQRF